MRKEKRKNTVKEKGQQISKLYNIPTILPSFFPKKVSQKI